MVKVFLLFISIVYFKMKIALLLTLVVLTFVRSIEICECDNCEGSCIDYPLDNCTQELNLCTGTPVAGSYITIEGNIAGLEKYYHIVFYDDNLCTNNIDDNFNFCNECWPFGNYLPDGFAGIIKCPGGGPAEDCEAPVVIYDNNNCNGNGFCVDKTLRGGICQEMYIDDQRFYSMVNCTANTTDIYTTENCTGTPISVEDSTTCASMGDYSVKVFFSDECPSEEDESSRMASFLFPA